MKTSERMPFRFSKTILAGTAVTAVLLIAAAGALPRSSEPRRIAPAPLPASTLKPIENLETALLAARSGRKDLVLEFLAPSNADAVRSADRKIPDAEPLQAALAEQFVLLPMAISPTTSPARLTEISTCAERLGIARFPTFVLLDTSGRPYASSEMVAADVGTYGREFRRLQQVRTRRDEAFARAAKAQGVERAKLLEEGLNAVRPFADSAYSEVEHEVVNLDPANVAGLKSKYETPVAKQRIDAVIQNEVYPLIDRGDFSAAIARVERLGMEIKPPPSEMQLVLALEGQLQYSAGDRTKALRLLDAAIAIDPQSESAARVRSARQQIVQGHGPGKQKD